MEPEGSLPLLQEPATSLCSELDQSSPCSPSHFLKINFNIILPSTPGSYKWSFSLTCSHQHPVCTSLLPLTYYMPAHFILFYLFARIKFGEEYRSLSSSLCSLQSPVTPFLVGPNILFSILFSDTLSLRSFVNVSDQVAHPYKVTGKIIVLHISVFIFLDSRLEGKSFCAE